MISRFQCICLHSSLLGTLVLVIVGCAGDSAENSGVVSKPPKTVSTMILERSSPFSQYHTTASVAPWKAERIGFELAGRVIQVIEPSEMIVAATNTSNGTALAHLDDERFLIALDAAKADAAVIQRRRDANLIAIDQRLPTAIKTAEAELELAESQLARAVKLSSSSSVSRSEVDTARTRASTSRLRIDSTKAELAQARAEQLALDAQVQQAAQRLAEAQRNLRNTVLYSSFPGQIAEVHAVPGTYVKEGEPIVTVQMVDPMLVEFEVTASDSRRYQRGDTLGVTVTDRDGQQQVLTGMVYTVDTIADINTRTFTVSLHIRNHQVIESINSDSAGVVARTKDIFPVNLGPIVTGNTRLLVEQSAIHRIGGEDYVWKITNRNWRQLSHDEDRELTVQRLKVKVTSEVIPFLGTWNFIAVEFEDSSAIDLEQDLVTGRLRIASDEALGATTLENWSGDRVLLEQTRWLLRAGDTVRVALFPESSAEGFYVPMKAVCRESGRTFVHVVDESGDVPAAKRVMVQVTQEDSASDNSLLLRIEPATSGELAFGSQVVVAGTHYVNDGDHLRIVQPRRGSEGGR